MDSVVSLQRLKGFPLVVWVMLVGIFLIRGTYYMVWPFLAVILYTKYQLSATEVGLLMSIAVTISVFVGFFAGSLSDKYGRMPLMYSALFTGIGAFALLAVAENIWLFIASVFLATLPRTLWDAPSKALLGDVMADPKDRELALQGFYFMTNAGAALGPLLGVWAGLNGQQFSFVYTSLAYLMVLLAVFVNQRQFRVAQTQQEKSSSSLSATLKLLGQDQVFLVLILANILIMFVFAHGDSSLVQYLTRADAPQLVTLISSMIIVNSFTIILLQFPLLKVMENLPVTSRIYVGIGLLSISQLWYALNPVDFFYGWLMATFLLSVAEAILFPNMNVQLDRLAPAHLRGSYFGAATFYALGYALAPVLGGIVLDLADGSVLFFGCLFLCLVTCIMYLTLGRLSRPDFAETSDSGV